MDDSGFYDLVEQSTRERHQAGRVMMTDGVIPVFYRAQRRNKDNELAFVEEDGKQVPVWGDFIEIIVPGQVDRVNTLVNEQHKKKFADQWESYQKGEESTVVGTNILEWQGIHRELAITLRAKGFYTVEQLAEASDAAISKIGAGGREVVAKAKEAISGANRLDEMRKENELMAKQLAQLQAQMAKLVGGTDGADDQNDSAKRRGKHRDPDTEQPDR